MSPSATSKNGKQTLYESIRENIKYSLSVSSISGVSHISYEDGRTKVERLFWILAIILMAGLAAVQGLSVLTHYNERPVIVTVDKAFFSWNLTFPSATVCFRDLREQEELKTLILNLVTEFNLPKQILTTEYDQFVEYLRDLAFRNYFTYYKYADYASGTKKDYLAPHQYMKVLDRVIWMLEIPTQGSIFLSPVGLPFNEVRPVLRIFTEYGPCMAINPDVGIYFTPGYFTVSTPYNGYKSIYYTKNVMASMSVKIGIKGNADIYFHSANEVVDITEKRSRVGKFYFKHSKYDAEVVTVHKDVKSLSVKQKNCRLTREESEIPLKHVPVYSHNLCKFECRIKIALQYCNCTPYYYRRLGGEPICNMTGMYCLSHYKDVLLFLKLNGTDICPPCPQNCEVDIFRESEIIREYEFPIGPGTFEMFIVFPDKIYARKLIFSLLDLIVQIGGIFSLFLGCSLLSFVEIVYFLTLRIFFGARMRNKAVRNASSI